MFRFLHNDPIFQRFMGNTNEPLGLSQTELEELAQTSSIANEEQIGQQCVICMDNIQENQECISLTCNHVFHTSCITQWFRINSTCPLCRSNEGHENNDRTVRLPLENFMQMYTAIELTFIFPNGTQCTTTWNIYNSIIDVLHYIIRTCGQSRNIQLQFTSNVFKTTESFEILSKSLVEHGIIGNQSIQVSVF